MSYSYVDNKNMEEEQRAARLKRLKFALLGGGLTGSILGGAGSFLGGAEKLSHIAKGALIGGATMGGIAGTGTAIGEGLLGPPSEDEKSPFYKRGWLGGITAGGALGGLAGGLVSGGLGPKIGANIPAHVAEEITQKLGRNIASRAMLGYAAKPSLAGILKGVGIGGGLGAAIGGHYASDEGMQLDTIQNQLAAHRDRRRKRQMMEDALG